MTTHGMSASSDLTKAEYGLICVSALGFAFGLSFVGWTGTSLILALLSMGHLARRRYSQALIERDSDSLEVFADQIYMLGYMLTLAAIVGVVLQARGRAELQTSELLKAGAVKLGTTMAGIVIMFWFKEQSRSWEQERKRERQAEDEVVNAQLRAAITGLVTEADALRTKVGGVVSVFDPATLDTMARFSNALAEEMRLTIATLQPLRSAAGLAADSIEQLAPSAKSAGGQLVEFGRAVSGIGTGAMEDISASVHTASAGFAQAGSNIRALSGVSSDLVKSFENLLGKTDGEKNRIVDLEVQFSQLRELSRTLEGLSKAGEKFDKAAERLEKTGTKLDKVVGQIDSASKSFERATAVLKDARSDFASSPTRVPTARQDFGLPAKSSPIDVKRHTEFPSESPAGGHGSITDFDSALPSVSALPVEDKPVVSAVPPSPTEMRQPAAIVPRAAPRPVPFSALPQNIGQQGPKREAVRTKAWYDPRRYFGGD